MTRRQADLAFDAAFEDLLALAYKVGYRVLGSRSEAEDVAQETLTRAYVRWRRVSGYAEPWVARVATNLALDIHRRRARREGPAPASAPASDAADQVIGAARRIGDEAGAVGASLDRIFLVDLLDRLPRRQREVVVLRYLADRTEVETARALGTTVGSVKQHAHRGLAALRAATGQLENAPNIEPGVT